MNGNSITIGDRNACVENLAAALVEAAFPVALRHGATASWIDLQLDLWKALAETVKSRPEIGCP